MDQTFMKEKKILPLVISMSLPMVISMCVNSLYNIVDSFFVAKLSEDAMTALGFSCAEFCKLCRSRFRNRCKCCYGNSFGSRGQGKLRQSCFAGCYAQYFARNNTYICVHIRYANIFKSVYRQWKHNKYGC